MTVTEEMLIAYADGEADDAIRLAVETAIGEDPALSARLARHQGLRAKLAAAFDPALAEPVPSRLLDAVAAGAVADLDQARARRRMPLGLAAAGMAACLALGLLAGGRLFEPGRIGLDGAAEGALASALDRQLAGQDQAGRPVRVGLTFRSQGSYCRTFQTAGADGLAGVACRGGDRWRVLATARSPAQEGEFRTASSLPDPIARAVEGLIVGEPLDAASEARAKAEGWK